MIRIRLTDAEARRLEQAFRSEAALGALRDRDDFRLLLMDLAMPDEAFAPVR